MNAGELRKRVDVLECRMWEDGSFSWVPVRSTWARVELTGRVNLFSKAGLGFRDAALTVRRQPLSLHNAMRMGQDHYFLTAITEEGRGCLELSAALCQTETLTARPQTGIGRDALNRPVAGTAAQFQFPAVLTELYVRNGHDEAFQVQVRQLVAVVPKLVRLRAGDLVVRGEELPYTVRRVLDLDPYKNEFVLERQEDV